MVEARPLGCGWFWFFVFLLGCLCPLLPSFNDDLGTMPTQHPYSWKKNQAEPPPALMPHTVQWPCAQFGLGNICAHGPLEAQVCQGAGLVQRT